MNLMFLSGWLYAPLLFLAAKDTTVWLILIGSYSLFMLGVFLTQILIIHNKIIQIKQALLRTFGTRASLEVRTLAERFDEQVAAAFGVSRSIIEDVHSVRNWPLSVDVAVSFILSTVALPLFVGLVVTWWGTSIKP
jgi:hypothetical protein